MIGTQGKKLTEGQIGLQKSLKGRINDKSVNVADIFEEKDESGNNKYTSEDIKAVLTTSFLYNNNDHTLLSWAILFENVNAFQDILNAARNIEEDLEKKILTEDRYRKLDKEGKEVESLPLLGYAKKYNRTQMIHIIEGRVKAPDTPPIFPKSEQGKICNNWCRSISWYNCSIHVWISYHWNNCSIDSNIHAGNRQRS